MLPARNCFYNFRNLVIKNIFNFFIWWYVFHVKFCFSCYHQNFSTLLWWKWCPLIWFFFCLKIENWPLLSVLRNSANDPLKSLWFRSSYFIFFIGKKNKCWIEFLINLFLKFSILLEFLLTLNFKIKSRIFFTEIFLIPLNFEMILIWVYSFFIKFIRIETKSSIYNNSKFYLVNYFIFSSWSIVTKCTYDAIIIRFWPFSKNIRQT